MPEEKTALDAGSVQEPSVNLRTVHQEFLRLEMASWDHYKICLHSLHVTENELWILLEIDSGSDALLCQAEIARNLALPIQTVNSALAKMAKRGWIELVPVPGNRKSKGVVFTEQGKEECLPWLEKIHQAEEQALGVLSDEEIQTLIHWIQKYNQALEQNLRSLFDPKPGAGQAH